MTKTGSPSLEGSRSSTTTLIHWPKRQNLGKIIKIYSIVFIKLSLKIIIMVVNDGLIHNENLKKNVCTLGAA